MEVKHYNDLHGNQFLEIISRQYRPLRELEAEHKKMGRRTWINPYDVCEGQWMLTVQLSKAA